MADQGEAIDGDGNGDVEKNPIGDFFGSILCDASLIIPSIKQRLDSLPWNQTDKGSGTVNLDNNSESIATVNTDNEQETAIFKRSQHDSTFQEDEQLQSNKKQSVTPQSSKTNETEGTDYFSATSFLSPTSSSGQDGEIKEVPDVDTVSPISFEGSSTVSTSSTSSVEGDDVESGDIQVGTTTTSSAVTQTTETPSTMMTTKELECGPDYKTRIVELENENQKLQQRLNDVREGHQRVIAQLHKRRMTEEQIQQFEAQIAQLEGQNQHLQRRYDIAVENHRKEIVQLLDRQASETCSIQTNSSNDTSTDSTDTLDCPDSTSCPSQLELDKLRASHELLLRHYQEARTINRRLEDQVRGQDQTIVDMRKVVHHKVDKINEMQIQLKQSHAKINDLQQRLNNPTMERQRQDPHYAWMNSALPHSGPPMMPTPFSPFSPWTPMNGYVGGGGYVPYAFSPSREVSQAFSPPQFSPPTCRLKPRTPSYTTTPPKQLLSSPPSRLFTPPQSGIGNTSISNGMVSPPNKNAIQAFFLWLLCS